LLAALIFAFPSGVAHSCLCLADWRARRSGVHDFRSLLRRSISFRFLGGFDFFIAPPTLPQFLSYGKGGQNSAVFVHVDIIPAFLSIFTVAAIRAIVRT
jgi:hypothetical protein